MPQDNDEIKEMYDKNTDVYSYEIKIPKDRVAVLIGKDGETKKKLKKTCSVDFDINSEEGDVLITGKDPLKLYSAKELVWAIGRGFNPDIAMLLLKVDYAFELVSLKEIVKNKNHLHRIKGRIIGTEGKTRRLIEELTLCHVSVYGKTIGIIGRAENVGIARQAVEMIIEGSPHASVYKYLEKKRRTLRNISDTKHIKEDIKEEFLE